MTLRFEKIDDNAIIPHYQTKGSAGMDLHSIEATTIAPGERKLVGTGLRFIGREGFEGQVRPRSGLANKYGITIPNSPGTVDSDYTGELKIILLNLGQEDFSISVGDRIAQFIVCPVFIIQDLVLDAERETGGFGSTGQ